MVNSSSEQTPQGLEHYGVLKCQALSGQRAPEDDKSPHYTINATDTLDSSKQYRIVINVRSVLSPPDLLLFIDYEFKHSITEKLINLPFGFTEIERSERKPDKIALDFIRGNLFDITKMTPVPLFLPGENDDVNDKIDFLVQQAIKKGQDVEVYAFGEPFAHNSGIHDIHMNQGNSGRFLRDNGVFQDGALFFHFHDSNIQDYWVAFFSAFQTQSFHTDDITGNPLDQKENKENKTGAEPLSDVKANVKIIAALVNPGGDDKGNEWVMLFNPTPNPVNVNGWSLKDRIKRQLSLNGIIQPGTVMTVTFSSQGDQDFQLGNKGGIITLVNADELKVDGVSYTKEDAENPGYAVLF